MSRVRRHCIVCGVLTASSRCPAHDYRKQGNTARGYGADYVQARRLVLAGSPSCWKCGRPATTADHVPPLRAFADPSQWRGELKPACAKCNYGDTQ